MKVTAQSYNGQNQNKTTSSYVLNNPTIDRLLNIINLLSYKLPGRILPYKRLLGMCRWMGSHFHDWTDYNGVAFLVELLEWDRTFSGFLV